jgi:hypothetical protein
VHDHRYEGWSDITIMVRQKRLTGHEKNWSGDSRHKNENAGRFRALTPALIISGRLEAFVSVQPTQAGRTALAFTMHYPELDQNKGPRGWDQIEL